MKPHTDDSDFETSDSASKRKSLRVTKKPKVLDEYYVDTATSIQNIQSQTQSQKSGSNSSIKSKISDDKFFIKKIKHFDYNLIFFNFHKLMNHKTK